MFPTLNQNILTLPPTMFDYLIENLADTSASLARRQRITKTQRDITALISVIEIYGASPSLFAFVNYDGVLGRAVASVPSVESLTSDLSMLDVEQIIKDLKKIDLTIAYEKFDFGALKEIVTAITIVKAAITAYTVFKEWKEDRENHIATVIPYSILSQQLHAAQSIGPVAEKASSTLPKTKDDYTNFVKQVVQSASSLSALGVHVSLVDNAIEITVDGLPQAQKANIESLGYRGSTITDLANQVAQASDYATHHISFMTTGPDESHFSSDENERQWQIKAWTEVADIVDTAARRLLRLVKLTESTIRTISPFYKPS